MYTASLRCMRRAARHAAFRAVSLSTLLIGAMVIASLAGCVSSMGGGAYSRSEAGRAQEVQFGVVEAVREVQIEGTQSGIGALSGAAIGGIAGGGMGEGRGSSITGILGAIAGGVGGAAVEQKATSQKGYEVTVRLESGRLLAVVQGADEQFKVGDQVKLLTVSGKTRVTHR